MWFKGIIMEMKEDYLIVMKNDGDIVRVKNKDGANVGDTIIFLEEDICENKKEKKSKNKAIITIISAVASIIILIIPIIQNNIHKPYALVSLDINPSIEIELNKNKKIISVNSLNKDGEELKLSGLKGLSLQDASKQLKNILKDNNYNLKNDSAIISFTFLANKEDTKYEEEVKNIIKEVFEEMNILYLKGNKTEYNESKEEGLSLGKYKAKMSIDKDITEGEIENMSVEEILNLLNSKDSNKKLDEDLREELKDELEDRYENKSEDDTDDIDNDENEDSDDENEKVDKEVNDDKDESDNDKDDEELEYDDSDDNDDDDDDE